ncbi:hypothetical protein JTB14_022117 [Gonioctena quinquepunctata]|nr:hypothetical protein JTB14_022117 [Gonioctena quinquepunctata]
MFVAAPLPKELVWDGRSRSHLGDQDERSRSRSGYKGERRGDKSERRIQANQGSSPIPYTPLSEGTDPPLYCVGGNEGFSDLMSNIEQLTSLVNISAIVRMLKDLTKKLASIPAKDRTTTALMFLIESGTKYGL